MKKRILSVALALALILVMTVPSLAVDTSQEYAFVLTEETQGQNVSVGAGEEFVIEFRLIRTDIGEDETYELYVMQNEVYYDTDYLELTDAELVEDFGGNMGGMRDRINLIRVTMEEIKGHLIFGRGLNYLQTVEIFYFDYTKNPFMKYRVASFDNDHLKRFLFGGIVGSFGYITLYTSFLLQACYGIRAKYGKELNIISQATFVAMSTYLVNLFSVDNLGTFRIFICLGAVFAAAFRENPWKSGEDIQ